MTQRRKSLYLAIALTVVAGLAWLGLVSAWLGHALPPAIDLDAVGAPEYVLLAAPTYAVAFTAAVAIAGLWVCWAWGRGRRAQYAVASLALLPVWQWSVYLSDELDWPNVRVMLADVGLATVFVVGLAWVVWYGERRWQAYTARVRALPRGAQLGRVWNPFHPLAWYYGRSSQKLRQSLTILFTYSIAFFALFILAGQLGGCREIYELPAGGGKMQTMAQTVQIKKVIKKKFVINPFSAISFRPPPIEEVKLQLNEITAHAYTIGQGDGDKSGYAGGTGRGKVRFIRLEYSGGDWDQDFGIGADLNMLVQYSARVPGQAVADQTESRTVAQLSNFPAGKSPPMMYLTGQKNITLSKSEVKILREYLLEKHGMLFGDNGGSPHFHNQFFAMMRQVLPEIEPVKIPLDDDIHRIPYAIPFLPYVAPHGGRDAWGWKVDGRWVCYYHPGDIGDAWSDGHAGVKSEVWEACYQLGVNVMTYANAEYSKWLMAQRGKK